MQQDLTGKVALVTGAGRGLGEAICRSLAASGVIVAAADVRRELADSVAAQLAQGGARCLPLRLDVGDEQQGGEAIRQVVGELGRLDILINNAGTDVTVSVEELSFADFDRVVR